MARGKNRHALDEVAFFVRERQLQHPCPANFFLIAHSPPPPGLPLPFPCYHVFSVPILEARQWRSSSPTAIFRRNLLAGSDGDTTSAGCTPKDCGGELTPTLGSSSTSYVAG
ncbi:hypothetical protein PVAP13_4KG345488 [Panicum virgatum]|uniref:Uncharacterized protein n=1 Tax=Panicum virgatum TaxID=38727 RepID=A0A8T0TWS6_PANVG|nr:hypothetical protein PVAP13_4KG345488 [Panicum virgatum]